MQELLKKFEQDPEIYASAQDAPTFRVVDARIPTWQQSHHLGRKYVSGQNEDGYGTIFPDQERSDVYLTENRGSLKDFVQKALASTLADTEESDQELKGRDAGPAVIDF